MAAYEVWKEESEGSLASGSGTSSGGEVSAEEKKEKFKTWQESNEALQKTIELVFSKAEQYLGAASSTP